MTDGREVTVAIRWGSVNGLIREMLHVVRMGSEALDPEEKRIYCAGLLAGILGDPDVTGIPTEDAAKLAIALAEPDGRRQI